MKCEEINPYSDGRHKSEQVEAMFDNIAPAYDFMNRAMTMGIDCLWRSKAIKIIKSVHPTDILDVATGTGDLAILMAKKIPSSKITGIDLSDQMLEIGCKKAHDADLSRRISFQKTDCLNLPMPDESFDCVTAAFGVRNFENLQAGYKEMARVLRKGGMICVLELSTPTSPFIKMMHKAYTQGIIPLIGKLISRDKRAYSYLHESIAAVPQGNKMLKLMENAGFRGGSYSTQTFGVCTIYTAYRE